MKKKTIILLSVLLILSSMQAIEIFTVNSISQTISKINTETGQVENDFAILGQGENAAPNKIALDENFAYVTISNENSVQKFNLSTGESEGYVYFGDSSSPYDLVISGDYLYVSGNMSYKIYKISLDTFTEVDQIEVGTAPEGLLVYQNELYCANTGFNISDYTYNPGSVSIINLDSFEVVNTLSTSLNPRKAKVMDDELHVVCCGDFVAEMGKIDIFSLDEYEFLVSYDVGGSPADIANYANMGYLANSWPAGIYVYNINTGEVEITLEDDFFEGGNEVAIFEEELISLNAGDYVENSIVYLYSIADYDLNNTYTVGVGATDVKVIQDNVAIDEGEEALKTGKLEIFPNPFNYRANDSVSFRLDIKRSTKVQLEIFNIKGQRITQLEDKLTTDQNVISWSIEENSPKIISSGIYFVKIRTAGKIFTGKMLIVK